MSVLYLRNSEVSSKFPLIIIPQKAGSYRRSCFSKIGLLIPKTLPLPPSLPSFVISILACFCLLLPSFASLHLSPCVISILACSLPSFVSLRLSPFVISILACSWLLLSSFVSFMCPPSWSPFWPALGCSCLHLSPFVISILACSWLRLPSFVSLHDLHSGLLLAAPAFICLPSFVSLRDLHSGLLFAAPAFICLPSFVSLRDLHSGSEVEISREKC